MKNIKVINRDALKLTAIIPMTAGHFASYLSEGQLYSEMPFYQFFLQFAALFAPPVFFFFISEGYYYTRSKKKYAARLLIFACITQIPFALANHGTLLTWDALSELNIFFTLFLGLIAMTVWDSGKSLKTRIILIALIDAITFIIMSEWMICGIPAMLGFHIFREDKKKLAVWFFSCMAVCEAINLIFMGINTYIILSVIIKLTFEALAFLTVTFLYNGKKGRHPVLSKWFFYIFYPLHLILIYFAKLYFGIGFP